MCIGLDVSKESVQIRGVCDSLTQTSLHRSVINSM